MNSVSEVRVIFWGSSCIWGLKCDNIVDKEHGDEDQHKDDDDDNDYHKEDCDNK